MNERLYRSRHDRVLAGVAGGLAQRLDADPSLIRILWVLLMPLTGFLALGVYIVMALVVPEEPDWVGWQPQGMTAPTPPPWPATTGPQDPSAAPDGSAGGPPLAPPAFVPMPDAQRAPRPMPPQTMPRHRDRTPGVGGLVVGSILVLVGIWLLLEQFYPNLNFDFVWPLFIVGAGVAFLVAAIGRGSAGSGMRP
jgi:phage shock protein PspC (stress-responsive transcriptional regulator)